MTLQDFKDMVSSMAYGMTKGEAHARGICISCQKPLKDIVFETDIERREYSISGLCPICFNAICAEPEEEGEE